MTYPNRFDRYDIEFLVKAGVSAEQAAAYPDRYRGSLIAAMVDAGVTPEQAAAYPDRLANFEIDRLVKASVTPEQLAAYPDRFTAGEVVNLVTARVTPEQTAAYGGLPDELREHHFQRSIHASRGEHGEIVVDGADGWVASYKDGRWADGYSFSFEQHAQFSPITDWSEVSDLLDQAKDALNRPEARFRRRARRARARLARLVPVPPTRYTVVVADNFHYMDAGEWYEDSEHEHYAAAVERCRAIVDRSLADHYEAGKTSADLYHYYQSFGEDPFVRPAPGEPTEQFSAWTYARQRCDEICRDHAG